MISGKSKPSSRRARLCAFWSLRTMLATPLLREGIAIGAIRNAPHGGSSIYRQTNHASRNLCRPGGHRHRECAAVSRNSRAKRFASSRQRRVKFSASSPARRRTCSRCSTTIAESAAHVCGAEDGVLRLVEGHVMRLAAHYGVDARSLRVEIGRSIDQIRRAAERWSTGKLSILDDAGTCNRFGISRCRGN